MNKRFLISGLITAVVLFVLNGVAYMLFLKDFFHDHPAISTEFMEKLYKPDNELIWWAIILSAVAIGFLVTKVIEWSGARTFVAGLKSGFVFAILLLCSVDFGLLASTNSFSTASAFADLFTSTTTITISSGIAAWLLGKGKTVG